MNFNHFKFLVMLLFGAFLTVYTNCGKPFEGPSNLHFKTGQSNLNVPGGNAQTSLRAFEKTVYPITSARCASCHASVVQPFHASTNVSTAHDAVVQKFKVNFANIPSSRLVQKLRTDNHNCWGDCSANADEMQSAIEAWNVALKNAGGAPTPPSTAIFTAESGTLEELFNDPGTPIASHSIKLNVEPAILRPPMTLSMPPSGSFVSVPSNSNTTLSSTDPNAGIAYFNFRAPVAGQYKIWGLVEGNSDSDNSFWVNVKNGNQSVSGGVKLFEFPANALFEWKQVADLTANLLPGRIYTLELRQREDGAKLKSLIVTADPTFNGQDVEDYFGITLVFDISPIVNASAAFYIDLIDYDAFSYKFTKPRIVTSSLYPIYVKNIKLHVNGSFNPQHSTYTVVDKLVTAQDGMLSPYSMIVLKDLGMQGDRVKFSFDELALAPGSENGGASGGGPGGTEGGQDSLVSFQQTVYPISRSSAYSCVNCHRTTNPAHASDNTLTAHNAALTLVDFNNPGNSRIVRKMRDQEHNCQAYCQSMANEFQSAIIEWRTRRN